MNLPNKITLARICLIPLMVFFYLATFIPYGKLVATVIFVVACLTDFVDGKIARSKNMVTTLGKFFDSIADKALIMAALILVVAVPVRGVKPIVQPIAFGVTCSILILFREFVISALRQLAAAKGVVLAADKTGKVKATVQFIVVALYMFWAFIMTECYQDLGAWNNANAAVNIVLIVLLAFATLLTLYSGCHYLVQNWNVFKDNEVAPAAAEAKAPVASQVKAESAPKKQTQKVNPHKGKAGRPSKKTAERNSTKRQPTKNVAMTTATATNRKYDKLIPTVMELFLDKGWASSTMLQRNFGVGYPRASKIIDQLEELGLISARDGVKPRKLLITREEFDKYKDKINL